MPPREPTWETGSSAIRPSVGRRAPLQRGQAPDQHAPQVCPVEALFRSDEWSAILPSEVKAHMDSQWNLTDRILQRSVQEFVNPEAALPANAVAPWLKQKSFRWAAQSMRCKQAHDKAKRSALPACSTAAQAGAEPAQPFAQKQGAAQAVRATVMLRPEPIADIPSNSRLFLGGLPKDPDLLKRRGVTLLVVGMDKDTKQAKGVPYLHGVLFVKMPIALAAKAGRRVEGAAPGLLAHAI